MTFSDRVEEVCREFNSVHAHVMSKDLTQYARDLAYVEERTINYVLGMLAIPLVRDSCGYITAFEITAGVHREVRS